MEINLMSGYRSAIKRARTAEHPKVWSDTCAELVLKIGQNGPQNHNLDCSRTHVFCQLGPFA